MGRKHTRRKQTCRKKSMKKYGKKHVKRRGRKANRSNRKSKYTVSKQRGGSGITQAFVGAPVTSDPTSWPGQADVNGMLAGNYYPPNKFAGIGGKCIADSTRLDVGTKYARGGNGNTKSQKGGGGNIIMDDMVNAYRGIMQGLNNIYADYQGIPKESSYLPYEDQLKGM